eukprot:scaffold1127_cov160-Amphora_coffeaeformis.AAC.2
MSQQFVPKSSYSYVPRWSRMQQSPPPPPSPPVAQQPQEPKQRQQQQQQGRKGNYAHRESPQKQERHTKAESTIVFGENTSSIFDSPFACDDYSDDENWSVKMCASTVSDITGATFFHSNTQRHQQGNNNKEKLMRNILVPVAKPSFLSPGKHTPISFRCVQEDEDEDEDGGGVLQPTMRQNHSSVSSVHSISKKATMRIAAAKQEKAMKRQNRTEESTPAHRRLTSRKKKLLSSNHHQNRATSINKPTIAQIPPKIIKHDDNDSIGGSGSRSSRTAHNESQIVSYKSDLSVHSTEKRPVVLELASCRLLSATALPIQRLIRRYLARRIAQERLKAVVDLQACARQWLVRCHLRRQCQAATKIQATFRTFQAYDNFVLQKMAATVIQSTFRGFSAWSNFQCDVLDIIIVQSVCRRKSALRRVQKIRWNDRAAPLIQAGLEMMGVEFPHDQKHSAELALPPEEMLVQMAAWMCSLRILLKDSKKVKTHAALEWT